MQSNRAGFHCTLIHKHELKGLMAVLDSRVAGLHTPMMAVITYRGFSLVAQSVLPIDKTTLLCGSDDSGRTIVAKSKELMAKLDTLGKALNLKEHYVWERRDSNKSLGTPHSSSSSPSLSSSSSPSLQRIALRTPVDLEGHLGHDGRYYVLDCSRLFPPVAPPKGFLIFLSLFLFFFFNLKRCYLIY